MRRERLSFDDVCTIIGMAAVWISIFKRMLYPVLHTYLRTGNEAALSAQGIYAVVLLCMVLVLALGHAHLGKALVERRWLVALFGIGGAIGLAILSLDLIPADAGQAAFIVAGALVALYIPTHLAFWILRLHAQYSTGAISTSNGFRNVVASIALFAVVYALLVLCSAQSSYISIACPLVSSAMACIVAKPVLDDCAMPTREATHASKNLAPEVEPQTSTAPANVAASSPIPPKQVEPSAPPATQAGPSAPPAVRTEALTALTMQAESSTPPSKQAEPSDLPSWISGFSEQFDLSEREAELTEYTYRNYSARKIAGELFIAESTVYTHQKRIYRKTGVHSKHELIELIDTWRANEGRAKGSAV